MMPKQTRTHTHAGICYMPEYAVEIDGVRYRFDFYLPDYNLFIEYDGQQHFNARFYIGKCKSEDDGMQLFERAQLRDSIKNKYCADNNITDLQVSLDNLESLTIENSIIDEYEMILDTVDTVQTLRLVGIDWVLADTTLLHQILAMNKSYLSGSVYISGQVRNQELIRYANAWNDLEVTYSPENLVPQHLVTYVNADADETVLYQTYGIQRGGNNRRKRYVHRVGGPSHKMH